MSDAVTARVESNEEIATDLHAIVLSYEADPGHSEGGQYVVLTVGEHKPGFYAIASAPGQGQRLEFLVQRQGETSQALCALKAGDTIRSSAAQGPGFRARQHAGKTLLLFAGGSGISAIRSVLEDPALADTDRRLFYGCKSPERMAYRERLASWEASGAKLHVCCSRPEEGSWSGATGYVQDLLPAAGLPPLEDCLALFCGPKGMVQGAQSWLREQGMDESSFLMNY